MGIGEAEKRALIDRMIEVSQIIWEKSRNLEWKAYVVPETPPKEETGFPQD